MRRRGSGIALRIDDGPRRELLAAKDICRRHGRARHAWPGVDPSRLVASGAVCFVHGVTSALEPPCRLTSKAAWTTSFEGGRSEWTQNGNPGWFMNANKPHFGLQRFVEIYLSIEPGSTNLVPSSNTSVDVQPSMPLSDPVDSSIIVEFDPFEDKPVKQLSRALHDQWQRSGKPAIVISPLRPKLPCREETAHTSSIMSRAGFSSMDPYTATSNRSIREPLTPPTITTRPRR